MAPASALPDMSSKFVIRTEFLIKNVHKFLLKDVRREYDRVSVKTDPGEE